MSTDYDIVSQIAEVIRDGSRIDRYLVRLNSGKYAVTDSVEVLYNLDDRGVRYTRPHVRIPADMTLGPDVAEDWAHDILAGFRAELDQIATGFWWLVEWSIRSGPCPGTSTAGRLSTSCPMTGPGTLSRTSTNSA